MLQQAASPFHSRNRRCISLQTACKRLEIDRQWNKLIENWLVCVPENREKFNVTTLQRKLQRIKRKINTGRPLQCDFHLNFQRPANIISAFFDKPYRKDTN